MSDSSNQRIIGEQASQERAISGADGNNELSFDIDEQPVLWSGTQRLTERTDCPSPDTQAEPRRISLWARLRLLWHGDPARRRIGDDQRKGSSAASSSAIENGLVRNPLAFSSAALRGRCRSWNIQHGDPRQRRSAVSAAEEPHPLVPGTSGRADSRRRSDERSSPSAPAVAGGHDLSPPRAEARLTSRRCRGRRPRQDDTSVFPGSWVPASGGGASGTTKVNVLPRRAGKPARRGRPAPARWRAPGPDEADPRQRLPEGPECWKGSKILFLLRRGDPGTGVSHRGRGCDPSARSGLPRPPLEVNLTALSTRLR